MSNSKNNKVCNVCPACFHYLACIDMDVEGHMLDVESPSDCENFIRVMNSNEFKDEMQHIYDEEYIKNDDGEVARYKMEKYAFRLLEKLGYGDGVEIIEHTPRY